MLLEFIWSTYEDIIYYVNSFLLCINNNMRSKNVGIFNMNASVFQE